MPNAALNSVTLNSTVHQKKSQMMWYAKLKIIKMKKCGGFVSQIENPSSRNKNVST